MTYAGYRIPLVTEVSAELKDGKLEAHASMKPYVTLPLTAALAIACVLHAVSLGYVFLPIAFQLALTFFYWTVAVEKVSG